MHMHAHTHMYISTHAHTHTYTHMYISTHAHTHTHTLVEKVPEISYLHLYQTCTAFQLMNIDELQDRSHRQCSFLPYIANRIAEHYTHTDNINTHSGLSSVSFCSRDIKSVSCLMGLGPLPPILFTRICDYNINIF